jgi:hypothetical protein
VTWRIAVERLATFFARYTEADHGAHANKNAGDENDAKHYDDDHRSSSLARCE